jgi:hypothetical protein
MRQISVRPRQQLFFWGFYYRDHILYHRKFAFQQLQEEELQVFQEDDAPFRFSNFVRTAENEIIQPSEFPDLRPLDVIIWMYTQSAITRITLSPQRSKEFCFISTTTLRLHGTGAREVFSIYTQNSFLIVEIK